VRVDSIAHKGLRRFYETGDPRRIVGDVDRLRRMLAFIVAASDLDELRVPPNYGLHPLTGDRAGVWAMAVTRNWRLTFRLNAEDAIEDMDLEDYHGA
jgi:toxin HigB-1